MSTTETTEQKILSAQAVDEEFEKLQRFHIDHRRIVLVGDTDPPEGGFGVVRRGELYPSAYLPAWLAKRRYGPPQSVAVKQIKITRMSSTPRVKRAFTREMLVWSSLGTHPGLARFIGFYADFENSKAWLLSPWEPNGNVGDFVKAHELEVPEKLSLVYDTIDALAFLHQLDPPVCHGDIKSANVLVSAEYRARLCDFGLARLHEDSGFGRLETSTGNKGSVRWCSPELIDGAPRAPTSDVYAWAWLVWEIMTGNLPYGETSADYAIIRRIFESPLPQVDGASRLSDCLQAWDLMETCWNVDPQQRPTARTCRTTVAYLPRCTPTPAHADNQARSATLLENLGDLESWKGSTEKSSAYFDEALQLYQEESDTKGIASVLRKQAEAARRYGDFGKAIVAATAALDHFRKLNDPHGIADASFTLGESLSMRDRDKEALPALHEALEIYRADGNDLGAALCLAAIGQIQRFASQGDKALSTLEEAVTAASRSGDRLGVARVLKCLGAVHLQRGDFDRAVDHLLKSRQIAQSIGWYGGSSDSAMLLGMVKMRLRDYCEAEALLKDSVSSARRGRCRWELAWGLRRLGNCFQQQSKLDEAASALEEACTVFQELSRPQDSVEIASTLVSLKSRQGDWDGALYWHDHVIAVRHSQKDLGKMADHLEERGEILVKAQRYDEAALHFEAAMVTRIENGYVGYWIQRQLQGQLCAVPKTTMKWERHSPLLCDLKKLQRRQPQLMTATLKLSIPAGSRES